MKRASIILILTSVLVSCNPNSDITQMNGTEISLTWNGVEQVTYNPDTYQLAYNSNKYEYRVYEDKPSSWFTVRCSSRPVTEGQTLSADVSWSVMESKKAFKALRFEVQKTDENGQIWLWNKSEKIGIIVKDIQ